MEGGALPMPIPTHYPDKRGKDAFCFSPIEIQAAGGKKKGWRVTTIFCETGEREGTQLCTKKLEIEKGEGRSRHTFDYRPVEGREDRLPLATK